jgi:hypothetical protein
VDGLAGPLTAELLSVDRCGHPDYPASGVAEAAVFIDPAVSGTGRWPIGIDPEYPTRHVIKVWVDKEGRTTGSNPSTYGPRTVPIPAWAKDRFEAEVWPRIQAAYLDAGVHLRRVANWQECNISFGWKIPPEHGSGVIGLAIRPGGPLSKNTTFWNRASDVWFGAGGETSQILYVTRRDIHEFGHNMGFEHSTEPLSFMYPSIRNNHYSTDMIRRDAIFPQWRSWYGDEKFVLNVDQPPEPVPPSSGLLILDGKKYSVTPMETA